MITRLKILGFPQIRKRRLLQARLKATSVPFPNCQEISPTLLNSSTWSDSKKLPSTAEVDYKPSNVDPTSAPQNEVKLDADCPNSSIVDDPKNFSTLRCSDDSNQPPSSSNNDCERLNLALSSTSQSVTKRVAKNVAPIKKYTVSGQKTAITEMNDISKLEAPTVLKRVHKGRPVKATSKVNGKAFA